MLFDFKCRKCGETEEHWVSSSVRTVRCKCGQEATRVINGGKAILDPISGDFPGATMKWARHHEKAAQQQSSE